MGSKIRYTFENKGKVLISNRTYEDICEIVETNNMTGNIYSIAKSEAFIVNNVVVIKSRIRKEIMDKYKNGVIRIN